MSQTSQLKVGLVGTGFLAQTRARCWRRVHGVRAELTAVCSRTEKSAQAFAATHGVEQAEASLESLLAREDIDLVDLCVPNRLHRPLAEQAAVAGKAILCTKPLTAYVGQDLADDATAAQVADQDRRHMWRVAVEEARAMVQAADSGGVALHYGENWIYAPAFERARALTARAKGAILEMHGWESHKGSHSPYSKDWRYTGGGALLRLGAHPIGAMLFLKQQEGLARNGKPIGVKAVTANVTDLSRNEALNDENTHIATGWLGVENWGLCVLEFEDGSRGVAHGSDSMLGGMQSRLTLLASDHHLDVALSPHDDLRAYTPKDGTFGDAYIMEKVDGQAGWSTPLPDEDWTSGQQGLCQAVAEAASQGRASAADGHLGLAVTNAVYAAYVSAAEGRRIELQELEQESAQKDRG